MNWQQREDFPVKVYPKTNYTVQTEDVLSFLRIPHAPDDVYSPVNPFRITATLFVRVHDNGVVNIVISTCQSNNNNTRCKIWYTLPKSCLLHFQMCDCLLHFVDFPFRTMAWSWCRLCHHLVVLNWMTHRSRLSCLMFYLLFGGCSSGGGCGFGVSCRSSFSLRGLQYTQSLV